jgi:hypothetical protein
MSAIDYMEREMEQDSQIELKLGDMASSFSKELSDDAKRVLFASMLSLMVSRKRRRVAALKCILIMNRDLLQSYVKFRGGAEKLTVYDIPEVAFDIQAFGDKECYGYFRFHADELRRLHAALGIPQVIVTSERDKCSGLEVLCMMCMNYAYPTRRFDMIAKFGSSLSRMSRLISHLRNWLWEKFYPGMSNPKKISQEKATEFSDAVYQHCHVRGIFSFIDGTVRPTCKPVCRTCVWPAKKARKTTKAKGDLKFTVYVLTVYKHSWVQRRAGLKVPARARSSKGIPAAVMTTQTYAPWRRENVNT